MKSADTDFIMTHKLSPLPFSKNALEPFLSQECLEFHYEKHHRGYIEKLNKLIKGTSFEHLDLENTILRSDGKIFNNAAQVWNHDFYWRSLSPQSLKLQSKDLEAMIHKSFDSLSNLESQFSEKAAEHFGSGYAWIVMSPVGEMQILTKSNANNPLTEGYWPLLNCDLWEHAYYIDYRNERPKYVEKFWEHINWEFVEQNFLQFEKKSKTQPYSLAI